MGAYFYKIRLMALTKLVDFAPVHYCKSSAVSSKPKSILVLNCTMLSGVFGTRCSRRPLLVRFGTFLPQIWIDVCIRILCIIYEYLTFYEGVLVSTAGCRGRDFFAWGVRKSVTVCHTRIFESLLNKEGASSDSKRNGLY